MPLAPADDRHLGLLVVAALVACIVWPPLALVAPLGGVAAGAVTRRRRTRSERASVAAALPEVVDLFAVAAGAGLNLSQSLAEVAPLVDGPLGAALRSTHARVRRGELVADGLHGLVGELGEGLAPLVACLVTADRYGTPVAGELDRLAVDVRLARRRHAERAARRLPVLLLFPLVLCTLPAFALLTVVPVLLGALGSLRS